MITIRREVCGYCGACVSVCPHNALTLIDTYLSVDESRCKSKCRLCSKVCPLGALSVLEPQVKPVFTVE